MQPLRIDELTPKQFELLCLELLLAEGHTEVRHTGASGADGGWDLRTKDRQGRLVCGQCKRVSSSFGPKAATEELEKVLEGGETPQVFRLMASCNLSSGVEKALKELAAGRCTIEVRGRSELVAALQQHPRLVDRYFRGLDPRAFRVYLSASEADRALARALRRDLETALRHAVAPEWSVILGDPDGDPEDVEVPADIDVGVVIVSPEALADRRLLAHW